MSRGYITPMDPMDMAGRFSEQDKLEFLSPKGLEAQERDQKRLDRIREIMDQLPDREADFIELYFFKNKKQQDIARIFGVSQPTVCYRIKRGMQRVRFLLDYPEWEWEDLYRDMKDHLTEEDIKILYGMYQTSCQTEVAKAMGMTQGKVRHRFRRTLKFLEGSGQEKLLEYAKVFADISQNLNILREIRRPNRISLSIM